MPRSRPGGRGRPGAEWNQRFLLFGSFASAIAALRLLTSCIVAMVTTHRPIMMWMESADWSEPKPRTKGATTAQLPKARLDHSAEELKR